MKDKDLRDYVNYLEKKSLECSEENLINDMKKFFEIQKNLTNLQFNDRENLIVQNRILAEQVNNLQRTIAFDNDYINFLTQSIWWKMSYPFRIFSRNKLKRKLKKNKNIEVIDLNCDENSPINKKINIIISTYNPGEEFELQIEQLLNQKLIENFEIIIVDRGSIDATINIAKKYKLKVINLFNIRNENSYFENSIISDANYTIYLRQNKIIDDLYWTYKSIKPLENNQAIMTAIFDLSLKKAIDEIKKESYFQDLKERFYITDNHYFLYLPANRNNIQFINPWFLNKACIVIKKTR